MLKYSQKKILIEINNGSFNRKLNKQVRNNYKDKNKFNKKKLSSLFTKTQYQLMSFLKKNKVEL